jgi:hypothetical protein
MNSPHASPVPGFQVAFLVFAVVLLNAPLHKFVLTEWQWVRDLGVDVADFIEQAEAVVVLEREGNLRALHVRGHDLVQYLLRQRGVRGQWTWTSSR